jgi:hypothetical protein
MSNVTDPARSGCPVYANYANSSIAFDDRAVDGSWSYADSVVSA